MSPARREHARPHRLLVVLPSWVGDTIMATPTLRLLRELLPASFIGGLARPGIDQLLAGSTFFDELHTDRAAGVMGPKRVAARLRPRRYDAALLLTNSFSTALVTRLAGIPRRIGYERDGRGLLLTDSLTPARRRDVEPYRRSATSPGDWAPIPAVRYYHDLAAHFLAACGLDAPPPGPMELVVTPEEEHAAIDLLRRAGVLEQGASCPMAVLNPGGNDPAKRWPPERFASLAHRLIDRHGLTVLVSGAPSEVDLAAQVVSLIDRPGRAVNLPAHPGLSLGVLKAIVARCRVMITNDTGPRHMAAALGVPVVSLFGPTDHRWTTIPFQDEAILVSDPSLPEEEVANDHPDRCRIDRIPTEEVILATDRLLASAAHA